ncbi:MAG: Cof-type HAD-IIB family hydrolase [Spirochaetia bacterium]|jgi:Cof subfamily protein (haloacid dehalogenase superfamily)|nr:Cof-type HAD-IIB family hydrolase [Spirochaetia bacterium]
MKKVSLIATDIDNTLLTREKELTPRTCKAIQAAVANGIHICFTSGRAPFALDFLQKEIGANILLGCYSGGMTLDNGHKVGSHPLEYASIREILKITRSLQCSVLAYSTDDCFSEKSGYWEKYESRITGHKTKLVDFESLIDDFERTDEPIYKLLLMDREEKQLDETIGIIKSSGIHVSQLKSSPYFDEINPPDVSKAVALQDMCAYFGIQLDETVAFGDYYNDIDIFKVAGHSFAMLNAPDEVKCHATDVTAYDCDHDGLAYEIERLIEGTCRQSV